MNFKGPTLEMSIGEFLAYSVSIGATGGTKAGQKFLFDSTTNFASYAAKQAQITSRFVIVEPAKAAIRFGSKKAVQSVVVRATAPLATLYVGALAFNAIGNTHANQTAGHIYAPGSVLGMGGTL